MAYSKDLRTRVVEAYERNVGGPTKLAELYQVSRGTVYNWLGLKNLTGSVERSPEKGGRKPSLDNEGQTLLRTLVEEQPDRTLEELCAQVEQRLGLKMDISTMSRTLRRLGLTNKKKSRRR